MAAHVTLASGCDDGLRFELTWTSPPGERAAELTRGRLRISVCGEPVWRGQDDREGFEWTWIELLEHLGHAWPYLVRQDGFPLGLGPTSTDRLIAHAENRWEEATEERRDAEESELQAFEELHDLACGVQGAVLPPLWIVREGLTCWISTPRRAVLRPVDEVLRCVTELGSSIADRVRGNPDSRASTALHRWDTRDTVTAADAVALTTGLDVEHESAIRRDRSLEDMWEIEPDFRPNELLAAARMAGGLSTDVISTIVESVRGVSKAETPELDEMTHAAAAVWLSVQGERPYDQGYRIATWLRASLGVHDDTPIAPRDILLRWHVALVETEIAAEELDAFACWGSRHGPCIFLNRRGRHSSSRFGINATLAHEICHLLIDRGGALPLAEVLGGRTSPIAERRARAFAAELLLPRSVAGPAFLASQAPRDVLRQLSGRYQVSNEIIAWQARNSGAVLPASILTFLRSQVSDPTIYY